MAQLNIRLKPSIPNYANRNGQLDRSGTSQSWASEQGFTLIELLVTSALGLLILSMALSATLSNRRLYTSDTVRTRINQNLRGGMDVLSLDVRQAGENLPTTFPAIEIVDGTAGATDELVVRRNLLDEVLKNCVQINAGSAVTQLFFADGTLTPGCAYAGNAQNYNSWRTYRLAHSNQVDAYIYDTVSRQGEFFRYTDETNSGTQYSISRTAGTWANTYSVGSSTIYILEEWRYRVVNGVLQIVQNGNTSGALNVVSEVNNFQISALLTTGATVNTFAAGTAWNTINSVNVALTGSDTAFGRPVSRTLSSQFFPRNILSN